jgi:peptidoglycan L-alanyl-D-glutamate endopeptidase CwlK
MQKYHLSKRSLSRLDGVDGDLVRVVKRAIQLTEVDFTVLEGLRSEERQRELYEKGASQTMNSRHLIGQAVDLGAYVDGRVEWSWPLYYKIAEAMKKAAEELGVRITWGGEWETFKDGPHFQVEH